MKASRRVARACAVPLLRTATALALLVHALTAAAWPRTPAQLIKDLLTDEGVSEDGMDAALAQRLSVLLVKAKEHTEAANIRNRATVEREVYNKVENYAAINELGHLADVPFLHPVGCARPRRADYCAAA